MDFDSIAKAGSMLGLGAGAVIVMDETVCMGARTGAPVRISTSRNHAGQCTPCREGTGWMYRIIHRIEHGAGRPEDLELLNSVAGHMRRPQPSVRWVTRPAMPVQSLPKPFRR